MQRFLLKLLPGLCLALLAGTALAGGVVVSLVGDVPNPEAGQPFDISFNIFSAHDGSPQDEFHPIVTAINADTGEKVTARAEAVGEVGHYQATLTLPAAGTWQWQILPEADYPAHLANALTPITVSAPAAAESAAAPGFAGLPVGQLVLLAALALVAVAAVLTSRLPQVRA